MTSFWCACPQRVSQSAAAGARVRHPGDKTDAVEGALQIEVTSLSAFKHIHGTCKELCYKHNIRLLNPPAQQFGNT